MNNIELTRNAENIVHGDFKRGFIARIGDQLKIWKENRIAVRELNALSDRLLRDIGLEREEIREAVLNQRARTHVMARRSHQVEIKEIRQAA